MVQNIFFIIQDFSRVMWVALILLHAEHVLYESVFHLSRCAKGVLNKVRIKQQLFTFKLIIWCLFF